MPEADSDTARAEFAAPEWSPIEVDGAQWQRGAIRTRMLTEHDDLPTILAQATDGQLQPGDIVCVSEKVTVLLTGHAVDARTITVKPLARLLARNVKPMPPDVGLAHAEKMQYVQDRIGIPRILFAAAAAAVTRPFSKAGMFYRIAGPIATYTDGMRPPHENWIFPPLEPATARQIAEECQARIGADVSIVDINDRFGTIRGSSAGAPSDDVLVKVLRDNPLGQSKQAPIVIVRRPA